jgi:hypothetical protein
MTKKGTGVHLTVDEMFDLTEVLDDLCDEIEDGGRW